MTRITIVSDIHGNLPALEAVLREAALLGVESFVLNGDFADGPFPAETLDRLADLGERAIWLRGNGDRWLAETSLGSFRHPDAMTAAITAWSAARLERSWLERLATLPMIYNLPGSEVAVCHATPRSDNEMFLVDSSFAHAEAAFAELDTATVVLGHSHMPFDRLFDRRRIVNAGSVGMPYGHSGAAWALMEGGIITLRRSQFDTAAAAAAIRCSGMPHATAFAEDYVVTQVSDHAAMEAFDSIRKRQHVTGDFDAAA